jgi:hypothetical protein
MLNQVNSKYQKKIKKSILRLLDKIFKVSVKSNKGLREFFEESEVNIIKEEIKQEFEKIVPYIPYIGGKKNGLTFNLKASALCLAFIRVLEKRSLKSRDIGKVIYEINETYYKSLLGILKWFMRKLMFSNFSRKKGRKKSLEMQKREYEENWVSEFLDGEDEEYDLGINYTECGICKLYEKLGAGKYVPYLCLLDYASYGAFGIIMVHTKTIGNGEDICDFRFYREGPVLRGWPPDDLKEFNKEITKINGE